VSTPLIFPYNRGGEDRGKTFIYCPSVVDYFFGVPYSWLQTAILAQAQQVYQNISEDKVKEILRK
jgi:hypothetical protein